MDFFKDPITLADSCKRVARRSKFAINSYQGLFVVNKRGSLVIGEKWMKKKTAIALCSLAVMAGFTAPAKAADSDSICDKFGCVAMAPFKAAALLPGIVIGTPIAVTRKVAEESMDATKKVAHDSSNPAFLLAAGIVGLPIGMFVGGVEGLYYGPANAFTNHDKPFSKEAFSLGEIGEK